MARRDEDANERDVKNVTRSGSTRAICSTEARLFVPAGYSYLVGASLN
jgi:hypothetical protein